MTEPEVTIFDNQITLLYKWSNYLQVPVRYLVLPKQNTGQGLVQPVSLFALIKALIDENLNLSQINSVINDNYRTTATTNDIVLAYFGLKGRPKTTFTEINNFYNPDDEDQHRGFRDVQELRLMYQAWYGRVQQQLERDKQTLDGILGLQQTLQELPPLHVSPLQIDNVVTSVNPQMDNPIDGIDLFNRSVVSHYVPFIQYNDDSGKRFYKIYQGAPGEMVPNYSVIVQPSTQTSRQNVIYMTVWTGEGDIARATKESFTRAVYSLETNRLVVGTPVSQGRNEQLVLNRLALALPQLRFGASSEVRIGGEFLIYDLEISDIILFDMILIQPLLNTYLYIEEIGKPAAEKRRPYIHYKSITADRELFDPDVVAVLGKDDSQSTLNSSVSVSLNQRYVTEDSTIFTVQLQEPTQVSLPVGTPYIHVNILRADNRSVANQFILILRRLLQFYKENQQDIKDVYYGFIPLLQEIEQHSKQTTIVKPPIQRTGKGRGAVKGQSVQQITGTSTQSDNNQVTMEGGFMVPRPSGYKHKIEQLQDLAPDLFVSGYARKCQCPLQPIIIGPRDVETWRNRTFIENGVQRQRQIMAFPRENSRWLFVCPGDSDPYPGVKDNKTLSNKDQYPYIPCCFKTDQMNPLANSRYNEYYRGVTRKAKTQPKVSHTIKTNKIPGPGRIGYVTQSISNLLKRYSEETVDIVRYGVVQSPNSLLHCLCVATDRREYINQANPEAYVVNLRRQIARSIHPGLLKQELFDYKDEEIIEQLSDVNRFLDPQLYYRALEETFNVNIYTFTIPREVGVTGDTEEELGAIEVPRFRLFRTQPIRLDRPTVTILKHWGAESDNLSYPQCELLVDYDKDNETVIKLFGQEMTQLCHAALLDVQKSITWSFQDEQVADEVTTTLVARDNIYSKVDLATLLSNAGLVPASQIIDRYGKLRALQYRVDNYNLTVISVPGQPINLPTILPEATQQSLPPAELVVELLGEPSAKINDGLWFQLFDIEHALLVPVSSTESFTDLPQGPKNPLISSERYNNPIQRLRILRRNADIIIQLLIWLLLLKNRTDNTDAYSFVNQYFSLFQPTQSDSSPLQYDFSRIPRILPVVNTVEEAISTLSRIVPTMFRDGKILVSSNETARKLADRLYEYQRNFGLDNPLPTEIKGLFTQADDFQRQDFTIILVGERDLQAWLRSLSRTGFRNVTIRERLDISYGLLDEPYLFINTDGKIYLIQNVIAGDLMRALNIAKQWNTTKVNKGFHVDPLDETDTIPPYIVYGISTAAIPIPIEDHTNEQEEFLQILTYGSNRYAAMLPIL
jgi:hypothetical protein